MTLSAKEFSALGLMRQDGKAGIFNQLSEASLQTLLQHSTIQDVTEGRLIVQQGDMVSCIYMILKGALRTFRTDADGKEATIRMLRPGDTCMEAVMFMGGPSPINVQALNASHLLVLPEKIIKAHVMNDAQFATNLLRIVARHYKNAVHQIDAMNIKSPLQRVGFYFLLKHLEAGLDRLDIVLPFRKQLIANYLGITPETFSRTLKQLREIGVDAEGEKITLRDAFVLCHFCDSDTAAMCPAHGCAECKNCIRTNAEKKLAHAG